MGESEKPERQLGFNSVAAATARAELRRRGYSDREVDGMIKKRIGWRDRRD